MNQIYFVDDIVDSCTIFVKKDDGQLAVGDEHDIGLILHTGGEWCFEPIRRLRELRSDDLSVIMVKLFELNNEEKYGDSLMPVGMVFHEMINDGMSDGRCLIALTGGHFCELSISAALEINEKQIGFFDDGEEK